MSAAARCSWRCCLLVLVLPQKRGYTLNLGLYLSIWTTYVIKAGTFAFTQASKIWTGETPRRFAAAARGASTGPPRNFVIGLHKIESYQIRTEFLTGKKPTQDIRKLGWQCRYGQHILWELCGLCNCRHGDKSNVGQLKHCLTLKIDSKNLVDSGFNCFCLFHESLKLLKIVVADTNASTKNENKTLVVSRIEKWKSMPCQSILFENLDFLPIMVFHPFWIMYEVQVNERQAELGNASLSAAYDYTCREPRTLSRLSSRVCRKVGPKLYFVVTKMSARGSLLALIAAPTYCSVPYPLRFPQCRTSRFKQAGNLLCAASRWVNPVFRACKIESVTFVFLRAEPVPNAIAGTYVLKRRQCQEKWELSHCVKLTSVPSLSLTFPNGMRGTVR